MKTTIGIEDDTLTKLKVLAVVTKKTPNQGLNNTSNYSMEYLRMALKLSDYYESVELSLMNDYPLRLKTEDFMIILAPRVSNE